MDQSGFITTAPTVLAANLGNNKFIVQVCPTATRLLDAAASSLQEIDFPSDFYVLSASSVDPYVAVLSSLGRAGLLKLVDGSRLEITYDVPNKVSSCNCWTITPWLRKSPFAFNRNRQLAV